MDIAENHCAEVLKPTMASISGINTKWWSNELSSNWAIELSGFAQSNWSPTTGEEDKNLPNTCWADSWIERTRDVDILGNQAGKEKEETLREALVREESGRVQQISHLLTLQECALPSCPPAACALCPRVKTKMSKFSSFQKTQISQWISLDNGIAWRQECVRFVQ